MSPEAACPHAVGPEPMCYECRLEARIEDLEEQLAEFEPCTECGVVFMSHDAYAEHLCQGRQGR